MLRRTRSDFGAVIFGALIVFVGVFYLLRNTLGFDLGDLDWDAIWPVVVIAIGSSILYRAYQQTHHEGPTR